MVRSGFGEETLWKEAHLEDLNVEEKSNFYEILWGLNWIDLAMHRYIWLALVNLVINYGML
jgi:hypothetical protein